MESIVYEMGEVTRNGHTLQVQIRVAGRKYPVTTVSRRPNGKFETHVLFKEARSITFHEAFIGFRTRDPHGYHKMEVELWDRFGYEDDRVNRLIARLQWAERLLVKAAKELHIEALLHHE
jgi:hypothetical protein